MDPCIAQADLQPIDFAQFHGFRGKIAFEAGQNIEHVHPLDADLFLHHRIVGNLAIECADAFALRRHCIEKQGNAGRGIAPRMKWPDKSRRRFLPPRSVRPVARIRSTTFASPMRVRSTPRAEFRGNIVECTSSGKIRDDGRGLRGALQHGASRQRQRPLLAYGTSFFINESQTVGIGINGETDIRLLAPHQIAKSRNIFRKRLGRAFERATRIIKERDYAGNRVGRANAKLK